jgi:hypothetical protein
VNVVVRSKKEKSDRKVEEKTKKDLTGPTLLEITGYPGGFNGSTQHLSTRLALKTKKKSPARG